MAKFQPNQEPHTICFDKQEQGANNSRRLACEHYKPGLEIVILQHKGTEEGILCRWRG